MEEYEQYFYREYRTKTLALSLRCKRLIVLERER